MLYVFYGTDENRARAKLRTTLAALEKKAPEAHVLRVTDEDVAGLNMEALLAAQGLFYAKRVVAFDKVLGQKGARAHVAPYFKEMAASPHIFLVLEVIVDAELEKQFKKYATKIELCGGAKKEKKGEGADWSITNALEKKDSRALWVALQKAIIQNTAPEQIHGQLFWKVKQMLLLGRRGLFSEVDLKKTIVDLVELPHEARRLGVPLEYALEKLALSL